jgi:predicted SnoaL-like aldol condensation-catalyzing enzyme
MNIMGIKDMAADFLRLVASGKVDEAFQKYTDPGMIHHNPYFRGDAESLKAAMKENAANQPGKIFEVRQALEEGDRVMVFSRIRNKPEDAGFAVVHLCRFEGDRISEMWDVGQQIPDDSPNENGMF